MRIHAAAAALLIASCAPPTNPAGQQPQGLPDPSPLANDRADPLLALFEHVLASHFAGDSAGQPTTCAQVRPTALTAAQEEALILRFPRLAPGRRCRAEGAGYADTITGAPAEVVLAYGFSCDSADACSGWVMQPRRPAVSYRMTFERGAWRFAADRRLLAQ